MERIKGLIELSGLAKGHHVSDVFRQCPTSIVNSGSNWLFSEIYPRKIASGIMKGQT